MHGQEGDAQFYGERRREKPRKQADDNANSADCF
jgi:hypothetical protein